MNTAIIYLLTGIISFIVFWVFISMLLEQGCSPVCFGPTQDDFIRELTPEEKEIYNEVEEIVFSYPDDEEEHEVALSKYEDLLDIGKRRYMNKH